MLPNNLDCWYLTQRWVKLLPNVFADAVFWGNMHAYISELYYI